MHVICTFYYICLSMRRRLTRPRFSIEANTSDTALLYLNYLYYLSDDRQRLKYSTKLIIDPTYWQPSPIYRVKESLKYPQAHDINTKLSEIEQATVSIHRQHPTISVQDFKNELDYQLGYQERPKDTKDMTLVEFAYHWTAHSTKDERTKQKYRTTIKHLEDYQTAKDMVLHFTDVTASFGNSFREWLYQNYEHSHNTASKYLAVIKTVCKSAAIDGLHNSTHYQHLKTGRIETSKQYLHLDELERLYQVDLSDDQTKERVRDLFLISCYTGLRYSDLSRLTKDHIRTIDGLDIIELYQFKGRNTKADNQVIIPVLPDLKKLLDKYPDELPKAYASQTMNRTIKQVLQLAKVDRTVKHKSSVKGRTQIEDIPVYEKISNHSARYTFINMMINDYDISPSDLSKITGQTIQVLLGYERGDKNKNAAKVYKQVISKIEDGKLKVV